MSRIERERTAVWLVRSLLSVAAVAIVAASWSVIDRDPSRAGIFAGIAGAALIGAAEAPGISSPPDRFLASILDRGFDGAILGTIAWAYLTSEPWVAAGALFAMGASFLAAYVRARGASLGYGIDEGVGTRTLRYILVCVGLLTGGLAWAMWVLFGVMTLAALVRASQVVKEERADR
jgi:hypothetical protein